MNTKPEKIEKIDKKYFRTFGASDRAELVADKLNEIIDHLSLGEEGEVWLLSRFSRRP